MVLVNRETNTMTSTLDAVTTDENHLRRDRKTSIAKIESFHIGKSPATLDTYAIFGRLASIFLLMIRTLSNEMENLSEIAHSRNANLCETVILSSYDKLMLKDPGIARNFFVNALKSSEENRSDRTLVDGVSLGRIEIPTVWDVKQLLEIPAKKLVHSIDISIQDMSLTLDDQ